MTSGRLRRLLSWTFRAGVVLAILVTVVVVWVLLDLKTTNEQSDLSDSEWRRLRTRLLSRAREADVVDAASPVSETEPIPFEAPTRPARTELDEETRDRQWGAYRENRVKGILELQPTRRGVTLSPTPGDTAIRNATLVNLNPGINAWYLLSVEWSDGRTVHYHLVNAHPALQDLTLDSEYPAGLTFVDTAGKRSCDLWLAEGVSPLESARAAATPYVSLCGEEVTLRLPVPGRRTTLEWATDFLRDNVWNGERITVFVRQSFFQDRQLQTAEVVEDQDGATSRARLADAPTPARFDAQYADARIGVGELGLEPEAPPGDGVAPGRWYRVAGQRGVFVSVVRPDLLEPDLFAHHRDVVSPLDEVERQALVYLVAFDLAQFEIGFAVGTEHPRVDWSERVPSSVRDGALPGPDGIADVEPLVRTGIVPRALAARAVATFTGGFKRGHGAFRVSELAQVNGGTHYGFIESGTVLSKLHPGLATLYVLDDGTVDMKTWTEEDDALLPRIAFARQNGLPIVEPDPSTGMPVPGRQVSQWAAGNWSGSQDRKFRTVRAGAALMETASKRFLVYAYFSSATPSGMARIFEGYACKYAMLLDMNALEHTYLAVYEASERALDVRHLVRGMDVLDKSVGNQTLPRFLGFADNRDFFYVLRKEADTHDLGS